MSRSQSTVIAFPSHRCRPSRHPAVIVAGQSVSLRVGWDPKDSSVFLLLPWPAESVSFTAPDAATLATAIMAAATAASAPAAGL